MESRWRGLPGSRRSSNEMGDKKIEEHVLEIERRKTPQDPDFREIEGRREGGRRKARGESCGEGVKLAPAIGRSWPSAERRGDRDPCRS